ncbi:MAG: hypothetical protein M3065_16845 [Actinomycetota bacterium]|nr:hypothetical protein [Actinomycetota bacterium]
MNVEVIQTNLATGLVEFDHVVPSVPVQSGGTNQTPLVDNDFAPFNTEYQVEFQATDDHGNVLATASTTTRTGPPK